MLPQRPTNISTDLLTSHSHTVPLSSSKPIPSSAYKLRRDADVFTPKTSPTTLYHEIKSSLPPESQNRSSSSSDSVFQIAAASAKATHLQRLPQAKPDIFTSDETDTEFFVWETAFDAPINSAPISAQQKLYFLYQHLDGNVKKVAEQLQYTVSASPEIAYMEARKKLKSRFGRPWITATDFENKLSNWPKISNTDAQGLREFSDFLHQIEIAMNHLHSLKISKHPSKLQALVEKLPGWFLTKWSTKVQTLQQEKGCNAFPTFTEFFEEVIFHADRLNIPQIFRQGAKHPAWNSLGTTSTTSLLPRKKIPGTTTMISKATGESKLSPLPRPPPRNKEKEIGRQF